MAVARLVDRASEKVFQWVHRSNLVYNTCWEDPRLDRIALQIKPNDRLAMITSAGCNALDYLLDNPARIHCIDVNPRQNALLELKIAAFKVLTYPEFFEMFGKGRLLNLKRVYRRRLRPELSEAARRIWDTQIQLFGAGERSRSFYYRGTSGFFARLFNAYLGWINVRQSCRDIFSAQSIDEQKAIYESALKKAIWGRPVRSFMNTDIGLALLGVPRAQRKYIEDSFSGEMASFVESCFESVFTKLPIHDNYFWWLYLTGSYEPHRCPEYLREENFEILRSRVDRIQTHTSTLADFFETHHEPLHKFILLDHMDWLAYHSEQELVREWNALIQRAAPGSKAIWRSGGAQTDFVDQLPIQQARGFIRLGERLHYQTALSQTLHEKDRVHTYGSFAIADIHT